MSNKPFTTTKKLSITEYLDATLNWFGMEPHESIDDYYGRLNVTLDQIQNGVTNNFPETNSPFYINLSVPIINKLVKDEYVLEKNSLYSVTIDGIIFIKQMGGYHQKQVDIVLQREQLRIENVRNRWINRLLVIGSIAAGVGAIALAIIEVYKICHHLN